MIKPFEILSDRPEQFLPYLKGEEIQNLFLSTIDGECNCISIHFKSSKVLRVSPRNSSLIRATLELRDKENDRV